MVSFASECLYERDLGGCRRVVCLSPSARATFWRAVDAIAPVARLPVARLPVARLPVARLPVARLPVARLPVARLPVARLPVARLPVARLPVARLPVARLPVAAVSSGSPPPVSRQCADRLKQVIKSTTLCDSHPRGRRLASVRADGERPARSTARCSRPLHRYCPGAAGRAELSS